MNAESPGSPEGASARSGPFAISISTTSRRCINVIPLEARWSRNSCAVDARHVGWQVRDPVAPEFGCSNRFVTHCLEQDAWDTELGRVGIDLWVTAEALAQRFAVVRRPQPTRNASANAIRRVSRRSWIRFVCLERHAPIGLQEWIEPMLLASPTRVLRRSAHR